MLQLSVPGFNEPLGIVYVSAKCSLFDNAIETCDAYLTVYHKAVITELGIKTAKQDETQEQNIKDVLLVYDQSLNLLKTTKLQPVGLIR